MKLSTALRRKGLPLILVYSIASILCYLTIPLMVPMVTADAPPHNVTFWVDPNVTSGVTPGNRVTVDIRINATGPAAIVGWQLSIKVNPDVLEPGYDFGFPKYLQWAEANKAGYFIYDWSTANNYTNYFSDGTRNVTTGTIGVPEPVTESVGDHHLVPQGDGANGTGKLVTIHFTSKSASAYTPIVIKGAKYFTSWNNPSPDEHEPDVIHGHYNTPVHDVAVGYVVPLTNVTYRGAPGGVKFSVEAFNLGGYTETFNVTFSYNKTAMQWEFFGNYSFTLGLLETKTKGFPEPPAWFTEYVEPGNYTIKASAILPGDVNSTNNVANTTVWVDPPLYDVAVTAISANTTTATAGDTVQINVTAANLGTAEPVNLTVTVTYDSTQIGTEQNATNVANVTGTANFNWSWSTSGVSPDTYNITATVSLWTKVGWVDTVPHNDANKTTITIIVRDAAVTNVVPLESQGYPTWTTHGININVTVLNNGTETISFNVTAYYGSFTWYEIGMQPVTGLGEGANTTLTFNWNLSGVAYGVYDIKANATLDGDVYLDNDEVIVYDAVKVKMVGDVDGNNYAGSWDLILLAAAYGSDLGEPDWNRQADFDDDTHVGSWDLNLLAAAYGTSY